MAKNVIYSDTDAMISSQNGKTLRNPSFELLRIVSMLMVVTLHFLGHGGVLANVRLFSANYFVAWMIESLAYVAVNCFVLISGYFLVNSKFKVNKLVTLYGQIWFYSVVIYLLFSVFGHVEFEPKVFICCLLPISTKQYWFATNYVVLYLFSPFLNIAIRAMTKKQLQQCIALLMLIWSIIPNVIIFVDAFGVAGGYSIYWFVSLYFAAAYIRLYYTPSFEKAKWLRGYFGFCSLLMFSRIVITFGTQFLFGAVKGPGRFYSYNSPLVVPASVCLFLFFVNWNNMNARAYKVILCVSPSTFAVYLIHDNKVLRDFLWNSLIKPYQYSDHPVMIFRLAAYVLGLYIICSVIEYLRQLIFSFIKNSRWVNDLTDNLSGTEFWSGIKHRTNQ